MPIGSLCILGIMMCFVEVAVNSACRLPPSPSPCSSGYEIKFTIINPLNESHGCELVRSVVQVVKYRGGIVGECIEGFTRGG